MAAPIVAAGGAKAAERAAKALLGDIYTRRWTTVTGTGKKKRVVDKELHVNPVGIAIAGGIVAFGALCAGVAMYAMGKKVAPTRGKEVIRILDTVEPTYKTITVTDAEAYTWDENLGPKLISGGHWTESTVIGLRCTGPSGCGDYIISTDVRTLGMFTREHEVHGGYVVELWSESTWVDAVYGEDVIVTHHVPAVTHEETVLDKAEYTLVRNSYGVPLFKVDGATPTTDDALFAREKSLGWTFVECRKISANGLRQWWVFNAPNKLKLGTEDRGSSSIFTADIDIM